MNTYLFYNWRKKILKFGTSFTDPFSIYTGVHTHTHIHTHTRTLDHFINFSHMRGNRATVSDLPRDTVN